ncbi:DNA alkylation repair protein [Winogradskyella tangerina]|uniref:DNA alkylation repair protein n=1 Tax=Winogradskyella tangerina TaxID=2023240 RepID=UPI000DBE5E39|nr:DNA alkylation repair protein [Winogradskyella tangerina]
MAFIEQLKSQFEAHKNPSHALQMQAYMKHLFPFYGIRSPQRKAILREVFKAEKEDVNANCRSIVNSLFQMNERELQYCAMEIASKVLRRKYVVSDFEFITNLITTKSHWDTVDYIAKHLLGQYILMFWDDRHRLISTLSEADHMWLNRSAILFQLGYKAQTDEAILFDMCKAHAHSNEFFIKKAIGWALREYAKTNPHSVREFTSKVQLKPLSMREALKHIK